MNRALVDDVAEEWTEAVRTELEQLVDREIANVRSRLPKEQLVRRRYLAQTG